RCDERILCGAAHRTRRRPSERDRIQDRARGDRTREDEEDRRSALHVPGSRARRVEVRPPRGRAVSSAARHGRARQGPGEAPQVKIGDMTLREAKLSDAEFVADMETAIRPDDPRDPVTLKDYWRHPEETAKIERFIAEIGGVPVGYGFQRHDLWKTPKRYGNVSGDLMPSHRTAARIDALFG